MSNQPNLNWKLQQILSALEELSLKNEGKFSLHSGSHQANTFSSNSPEQLLSYRSRGRRGNPKNRHPGVPHA